MLDGGTIIQRHWTHALFRLVRHFLGFKFEIQLLVIAELVGTAYYRLLQARGRDPVLEETCTLLLRDEERHIEFHAVWLGTFLGRLLPIEVSAWRAQFQFLFAGAAWVAWFDHRAAFAAVGARRSEFFNEARRECICFLRVLERNAPEPAKERRRKRSRRSRSHKCNRGRSEGADGWPVQELETL